MEHYIDEIEELTNYKLEFDNSTILLYNPFHDKLGRFASKNKFGQGPEFGLVKIPIKQAVGFAQDPLVIAKKPWKPFFNKQPKQRQGLLVDPAEYVTRKKGLGPKLSRLALNLGAETAFSWTVASAAFTNGSWLGAMGTAALAASLLGGASPALTIIGGLVVGAAASAVVTQVFRVLRDKYVYAYIDRKAPSDNQHLALFGNARKGVKGSAVEMTKTGAGEIVFDVAINMFGPMVGLPANWSVINSLKTLEEQGADEEDFVVCLMPYLSAMVVGRVNSITVPIQFDFPGFRPYGNGMILTNDTLDELAFAIQRKELPPINVKWGNNTFETLQTETVNDNR